MCARRIKPAKFAASACKELDDLRQDLRDEPGGEPLHDFRVNYKKLRAFYRMNKFVMDKKNISLPSGWKKIYCSGGPLRDAELLSLTLQKINQHAAGEAYIPPGLKNILDEKIVRLQAGFRKLIEKEKPRLDRCNNWKKINATVYECYFKKQLEDWLNLYRPPLYDDVIHELRKILKDILYNHTWLRKMDVSPSFLVSQLPISDIDRVQKLLGDYQDAVVRQTVIRQLLVMPQQEKIGPPGTNESTEDPPEAWLLAAFRVQKNQRRPVDAALDTLTKLFKELLGKGA